MYKDRSTEVTNYLKNLFCIRKNKDNSRPIRFTLIRNCRPYRSTKGRSVMNSAFLNFLAFLWTTAGCSDNISYRQLRRNGKTPDYAFSKDFYGLKYKGNLNNNIDANVFFYGAFEKPLLFFLRDTLNALITETPKAILWT